MKIALVLFGILLLASALVAEDAFAARMGGGRSFGSRPSMSQPAQAPAMRQNSQATAPHAGAAAAKPGMGMLGGLAGGLLAGTLLGSLFSGNGLGGGGFMDILLLAILAFVGWKLFTRFRNRQPAQQNAGYGAQAGDYYQQPMQREANPTGWSAFQTQTPPAVDPAVDIPADFDTEEFLKGAKAVYTRMQKSWDRRDLNDIAQFATPTVMRELQNQAAQDPGPSQTEIMTVNASVAGVEPEGDNLRAQVYFDVLMREDPSQGAPSDVREIWHFLRIGKNGNWKLDGIQQVN